MFVNLDLLLTEVVECFVVCHWAVSFNKLTERHVSRAATNVIEVIRDDLCQPRELYESLIETFSFSIKRWFTCICDFWPRFPMLHIYLPFLSFLGKRDRANEMHFNIFLLIGDQYC